jgi:PKD repeat protein
VKIITATAAGVTLNDQPTITVQKTASTVEIMDDEPDPSTVGEPITVEFRVRGSGGMPTGEVVVTLSGGEETCRGTLTDGNGSCELTPTAAGPGGNNNRRVITATYGGDARFSGGTDTDNHRVNPAPTPNQAPTAGFSPPTCTVGQPCPFDDTSTDSDGNIASRSWTFQDGVPPTSGDDTPEVTFATEGSKSVTLTVTDDDGATNSVTHSVTVTAPAGNTAPTANFTMTCDSSTFTCTFDDTSTDPDNDIVVWSWDFGDGTVFQGHNPNPNPPPKVYAPGGPYTVTLVVTDDNTEQGTTTQMTPTFP